MKTSKLGAEAVLTESGGVETLSFPRLGDPKVLSHFISTRVGGVSPGSQKSLNVSFKVGDEPARVWENRKLLSKSTRLNLEGAVWVDQVHGDKVLKLDHANRPKAGGCLGEADALITKETGVPLQILVADCLPVMFFDPIHKAAGIAHAGWRGTVSHIAAKTLLAMGESYGTRPEEVRAVLGPAIGACCYEVGADVRNEFNEVFPWTEEVFQPAALDHWRLDLAEANARQLLEIGMEEGNLIRSGLCTIRHMELFYSHRVEAFKDKPTGRVGAFLMLKS